LAKEHESGGDSDHDNDVLELLEQMCRASDQQVAEALAQPTPAAPSSESTRNLLADHVDTEEDLRKLPPIELPKEIGRFQIERLLGQGGYGLVLLALDPQLKRHVALKIPRSGALLTEELQQRFVREAEAAAALNHAHIVPVYEVGRAGPICFIASAYCDGESLADRLTRCGRMEPDKAAALTSTLADAVQHAHNRGVLHRDLKPANILLTSDSSSDSQDASSAAEPTWPMITDFGLARMVDDDQRITATGSILGTPAYMAPEQAAGDNSSAGGSADIYSLGAILYELLTGKRPFQKASLLETLDAVRHDDPIPIRRLHQTVPRDLEAIALKCLEKQPTDRYATCSELGADLERFLHAEPVQARRPTGLERAARWCRRKPLQAALLATLFLGLASIATVSSVAYRRVSLARDAEARRSIQLRDSLDDQVSFVLEDLLSRQQELTDDHRAYLKATLASYQQFADDEGQDHAAREGVARAHHRVGEISARLGDTNAAIAAYEESILRFQQLAAEVPDEVASRFDRVKVQSSLSRLLKDLDRIDEAEATAEAALETITELVEQFPNDADYRQQLAAVHGGLGNIYKRASRMDDAERAFQSSIRVQEKLVHQFSEAHLYRAELGKSYGNLARLMWAQQRFDLAEPLFIKGRDVCRQLVDEHPDNLVYRESLASALSGVGAIALITGQNQLAEESFRENLTIHRLLAADFPANHSYQTGLVEAYNNLGILMMEKSQPDLAEENWRSATGIVRRLVDDFPDVPDYHAQLASLLFHLAPLLLETDDAQAALDLTNEGRSHLEIALQINSRNPQYQHILSEGDQAMAKILPALGRHGESAEAAQRVLDASPDPDAP
jgi:serine/threonine protein kinase